MGEKRREAGVCMKGRIGCRRWCAQLSPLFHLDTLVSTFLTPTCCFPLKWQARLWLVRDRLHAIGLETTGGVTGGTRGTTAAAARIQREAEEAGGEGAFSPMREREIQEIRHEVLAVYGALRAIPDISLSLPSWCSWASLCDCLGQKKSWQHVFFWAESIE